MKKKLLAAAVCAAITLSTGIGISSQAAYAAEQSGVSVEQMIKQARPNMIVDGSYAGKDGAEVNKIATYKTINAAVAAIKAGENTTVFVKSGVYREKVKVDKPKVTFIGENPKTTQIVFNDAEGTAVRKEDGGDGKKTYTMNCATFTVTEKATDFSAANITFNNDFDESTAATALVKPKSPQAFAITVLGNQSAFLNCRFLGNQDTLYANAGKQYYKDCYVEGDVDFIFGGGDAVFENCEIKSLDGRKGSTKGYITAPSTLAQNKGYLFLGCKLTSDVKSGIVYLGRNWHPSKEKREVKCGAVYMNCEMGAHIGKVAWKDWQWKKNGKVTATFPIKNERMGEYGSTGPGAVQSENRPVFTAEQAKAFTKKNYLGSWNADKVVKKLAKLSK